MMDIFKLNFGSKLVKGIVTKAVIKYVKKHFGVDIELELDKLDIDYEDGDMTVKTNLQFKVDRKDMKKILTKLDDMM